MRCHLLRLLQISAVVAESVGNSVGQAGNVVVSALCLERAQQLTERDLSLAPHDEVDAAVGVLGVGFGSEARILAAATMRARGRRVRTRSMIPLAVLRWKVMTESPTTSGSCSATSLSTVSRTRS